MTEENASDDYIKVQKIERTTYKVPVEKVEDEPDPAEAAENYALVDMPGVKKEEDGPNIEILSNPLDSEKGDTDRQN